jgi:hypothetical protein
MLNPFYSFLKLFTQTQSYRKSISGKLKNFVTTFGNPFNVIYFIEDPHPKKRSSYVCKQGEAKRFIKKDDKDAIEKDLR